MTTGQPILLQFTTHSTPPSDHGGSPVGLQRGRQWRPAEIPPGCYAASCSTSDEDDDDDKEDDEPDDDEPGASEIMLILPLS